MFIVLLFQHMIMTTCDNQVPCWEKVMKEEWLHRDDASQGNQGKVRAKYIGQGFKKKSVKIQGKLAAW